MTDLEQLFNDAMAWGMVYGETLCASSCWHEERDRRAKEYAEKAKKLISGTTVIHSAHTESGNTLRSFIQRRQELEEDEGYSQAFNSGGRDYD